MGMTDLNCAELTEITAAGLEPAQAVELRFWRPYRSWDDLLLLPTLDEDAPERLRRHGFEISVPADEAWAAPKPFRLSAATA